MHLRSFLGILLLSISSTLFAQTLKSWTWDYYKMKFKIPDNMVIRVSNSEKFQASNISIVMDVYPRLNENLTYDGMKNAVINWAKQTSVNYNYDTQPIYIKNINRYWGCAINGTNNGFPHLYFC